MKLTKILLAVALVVSCLQFAEAAGALKGHADSFLQIRPPPPPPDPLHLFHHRRRPVHHYYHRRHRIHIGIHLPPPPPRP